MVRADAIAATSTTRRNRDARSLSMFSPKLRALPSGRVCVDMSASEQGKETVVRRVETIPESPGEVKEFRFLWPVTPAENPEFFGSPLDSRRASSFEQSTALEPS